MSVSASNDDETRPASPLSTGALLALTFVDTTWRLFIPSVGLTLAGVWLDDRLGTKPWLMVIGIIIGSGIAIYLVRLQLKKVSRKTNAKK